MLNAYIPILLFLLVAIGFALFTLVMSNVGATVLLVPLAVNIAIGAGANPAVFALTVALATSNSFLLPTHQVNALIMGPAGYKVTDFLRAGGIMTLLFLAVMMVMLPLCLFRPRHHRTRNSHKGCDVTDNVLDAHAISSER